MFGVLSCTVALLIVSQALSAPLGISDTSLHKRQNTGPVCLTYHTWNPEPSTLNPTACNQTMADIRAAAKPYVSLPRAEFDAHKTATWPNPLCGREVEITNIDTGSTVIGTVMDCKQAYFFPGCVLIATVPSRQQTTFRPPRHSARTRTEICLGLFL